MSRNPPTTAQPAAELRHDRCALDVREACRSQRLRSLIESPELTVLMEAHSGLSARVAERSGFPAIWASGLALSSALGLRDASEATWSELLSVLEWMLDATTLPILFDGDSGYGNLNNLRRLVRILERRGDAVEIRQFVKLWDGRAPVVAAPTSDYRTSFDDLATLGLSGLICANHSLRAAMRAMEVVGRQILRERSLVGVEACISRLEETFDLFDYEELRDAEERYLPCSHPRREP